MNRAPLPPSPKGQFLIGNLLQLVRDPLGCIPRFVREYGDVVRLKIGTMRIYLISHPDDIEWVLRGNHRNFRKDKMTRNLSRLLGEGLLTSEGDVWRRQRRLAQPSFPQEQIEKYSSCMVALTEHVLDGWRPGQTRDLHTDMMRLTLEIAGQTLFGANVGDMADEVGHIMEVAMNFFANPLSMFPWLHWLPIPSLRRFRKACRQLDTLIHRTIAERRASGQEGNDLLWRAVLFEESMPVHPFSITAKKARSVEREGSCAAAALGGGPVVDLRAGQGGRPGDAKHHGGARGQGARRCPSQRRGRPGARTASRGCTRTPAPS